MTVSNHQESLWMLQEERPEKLRTVSSDGSQNAPPYYIFSQPRARGPGKQSSPHAQPVRVLSALVEMKALHRTEHQKGDLNENQKCSNAWDSSAICDDGDGAG
jgi:hypothetical protein